MKKLIALMLTLVIGASIQVYASGIEIQPTMQTRTNAQDRLWAASFQLVWNDFIDKVIHNPVRFREGNPSMVNELNKQEFTDEDISGESVYKFSGKVKKDTKRVISKALRKKFKETSDILDNLDLEPRNDKYLIYAMMKKDFEFKYEFDKLGRSAFGDHVMAEYFGVDKNSDDILNQAIKVLFYNDSSDYAVSLVTKTNDEVILYKNSSNKPFNYIYDDLMKKQKRFKGKTEFRNIDELKVPRLSFFEEKAFEELASKRIMGTNMMISQAIESVRFDMNNKGVKLKNEAGMSFVTTSLLPPEELIPRLFYFDNTFVVFLKESDKKNPYFALRVNDITKFQKK